MTPDRVRELIDAYGASQSRWPPAERAQATALVAQDASLTAYQREAAALDGILDQAPEAEIPAGLVENILADAAMIGTVPKAPGAGGRSVLTKLRGALDQILPEVPLWQPATGFAASLAVGVWVGSLGLIPLSEQLVETDVALYESDDSDVLSLIYGGEIGFGEWANDG